MTREELKARKPKMKSITVDGETFIIRKLSQADTNALQKYAGKADVAAEGQLFVVGKSLCDESGALLYDVSKPEDKAELAAFDFDTIVGISNEVVEFNQAMKDVKDKKDAADAPKGGSSD